MKNEIMLAILSFLVTSYLIFRINARRKISANLVDDIAKYLKSYNYASFIYLNKKGISKKLLFKMCYEYDYVLNIIQNYLSKIGCTVQDFIYGEDSVSCTVKVDGKSFKMKIDFGKEVLKTPHSQNYCLKIS